MDNPNSALNSADIQAFLSSQFHDMSDFLIDLPRMRAGETVFGPNRHSRILFLENPGTDIGHFTLITEFENHIEWFDPRAGQPPQELYDFAKSLGKGLVGLSRKHPLQGSTTYVCGKWCILRYLSLPTDLGEFCAIFLNTKKMSPDSVVDKLIHLKIKWVRRKPFFKPSRQILR